MDRLNAIVTAGIDEGLREDLRASMLGCVAAESYAEGACFSGQRTVGVEECPHRISVPDPGRRSQVKTGTMLGQDGGDVGAELHGVDEWAPGLPSSFTPSITAPASSNASVTSGRLKLAADVNG